MRIENAGILIIKKSSPDEDILKSIKEDIILSKLPCLFFSTNDEIIDDIVVLAAVKS